MLAIFKRELKAYFLTPIGYLYMGLFLLLSGIFFTFNNLLSLSSHILPEVSAVCRRVLIIDRGRIVADDSPENLAKRILGGSHIHLRVDAAEAAVTKALGKVASVKNLEFKESQEPGAVEAIVEAAEDTDIRRDLFKTLAAANIPILLMHSVDMSLEDIFLNLTTKEEEK